MIFYTTCIFILVVNLLIITQFDKIQNFLGIYDYPDEERKLHSKKIPIVGGTIVMANLLMLFALRLIPSEDIIFWNGTLNTYREIFSFFITSILLFLVGLYDDKNSISPNLKLLIISFIIYFSLEIDPSLVLEEIRLSFNNENIFLKDASKIITLMCFLLFINAYNMIDGIDLLAGLYAIFIFLYFLLYQLFFLPSLVLLLGLLVFVYLNFKKKTFLGDSGTLLIAYTISYIFIKAYNQEAIYSADSVILLMIIPGLDLFRLAIERLYRRKNPFKPDRAHLHHLCQSYINNRVLCSLIILIIFFVPYGLSLIVFSKLISLILAIIFYSFLIVFLRYHAK